MTALQYLELPQDLRCKLPPGPWQPHLTRLLCDIGAVLPAVRDPEAKNEDGEQDAQDRRDAVRAAAASLQHAKSLRELYLWWFSPNWGLPSTRMALTAQLVALLRTLATLPALASVLLPTDDGEGLEALNDALDLVHEALGNPHKLLSTEV